MNEGFETELLSRFPQKVYREQKLPSYVIAQNLDLQLGEPSKNYPIVHVTGTNGKGSVVCKIASAYAYAGYKVGVFTSPHLYTIRERIKINDQMISADDVQEYSQQVLDIAHAQGLQVHFFEIMTAIALRYFADRQVDLVVFEVGIGGRFDSTNFITPILSVITSISYDHTSLLGRSLDEIAWHKAGVIKKEVPVVLGPSAQRQPIIKEALIQQAPIIVSHHQGAWFDDENSAIARTALNVLQRGFVLSEQCIEQGLAIIPSCRFEMIQLSSDRAPEYIIFDVAHNPDGFIKLLNATTQKFGSRKLRFLVGMSQGKEIRDSLKTLIPHADYIYLAQGSCPKLLHPQELQKELHELGFYACGYKTSLAETMSCALEESALSDALLIVCGSFYIMSDVKNLLK